MPVLRIEKRKKTANLRQCNVAVFENAKAGCFSGAFPHGADKRYIHVASKRRLNPCSEPWLSRFNPNESLKAASALSAHSKDIYILVINIFTFKHSIQTQNTTRYTGKKDETCYRQNNW